MYNILHCTLVIRRHMYWQYDVTFHARVAGWHLTIGVNSY